MMSASNFSSRDLVIFFARAKTDMSAKTALSSLFLYHVTTQGCSRNQNKYAFPNRPCYASPGVHFLLGYPLATASTVEEFPPASRYCEGRSFIRVDLERFSRLVIQNVQLHPGTYFFVRHVDLPA